MLPNLTVRSARASDQKALEELVQAIGPQCVVPLSGGCASIVVERSSTKDTKGREGIPLSGGCASIVVEQTLVAIQGDFVIGFVAWYQDEMQAVVVGLGVRATHRRFGVATQLVNALIAHLREMGLRLLEAVVPPDRTDAIAVFESAGFRPLGHNAFELKIRN